MLEDIEAIKSLHREYLFYISNLEFDLALGCFAEMISVEIGNSGVHRGKQAVTRLFKDVIHEQVFRSKDAHFTGQPVISLEGEKAKGHWMFYRFLNKPSPQGLGWFQARYDCEYVKENGQWKFSVLKLSAPWPEFFKQ
jgi:hypothetical protein